MNKKTIKFNKHNLNLIVDILELGKSSFHHFPVLELDNGDHIFSSDAIIKFVLPNEEPMEMRDQVIFIFKLIHFDHSNLIKNTQISVVRMVLNPFGPRDYFKKCWSSRSKPS